MADQDPPEKHAYPEMIWYPSHAAQSFSALHVLGHWQKIEFRDMEDTRYVRIREEPQ